MYVTEKRCGFIGAYDPLKYVEDYEGTWVSNGEFVKSAIKAVRYGEDTSPVNYPISDKLKVYSKQLCFYYVKPTSPFKEEHNFAHSILHLANDRISRVGKKQGDYKILSVVGANFSTLNEIIRALLVQYFRLHGHLKRISICNYCDSLYLQNSEDYQKYCSRGCNQDYHQKNRSKIENNCREKQRGWFKRYTKSTTHIKLPAEKCAVCFQPGVRGGGCEELWKEHEAEVKSRFYSKHKENVYFHVCRKSQLDFFERKIRFINKNGHVNRGNIANRKFCLLCPQCINHQTPKPGTCKRILTKFTDRITSEQ